MRAWRTFSPMGAGEKEIFVEPYLQHVVLIQTIASSRLGTSKEDIGDI